MSAESSRLHAARSSAGPRAPRALEALDGPETPTGLVPGPVTETRRRVIAATNDLIDRHTYRAVTIDAVARASGVSKSTIYRHWPSRQVLVLEAFNHKTELMTNVPDSGDAFADLRSYVARLASCLDFGGAASTVSGLIGDALADEEFARLFRATIVRGRRRAFGEIVRRGQRRGQIRSDIDAGVVVDALYGAIHHRLLLTRQPFDQPFVDALADFAVRGLSAPPDAT